MYPMVALSPQRKNWGEIFSRPLGSGAWSKLFLAIVSEKEYPKLVLKFWRPPKKFLGESKLAEISRFSDFFCPFLQNGARYCQSKNGFVICGHSSTRWLKIGVLRSTANYVIESRKHPPSYLIASLYIKRLTRGCCGRRYSSSTQ